MHLFTHSPRSTERYVSPHDTISGRLDMDSRNSTIFNTIYLLYTYFFFFGPRLLVKPPPRFGFIHSIAKVLANTKGFGKGKSSLISNSELRVNFKRIFLYGQLGSQSGERPVLLLLFLIQSFLWDTFDTPYTYRALLHAHSLCASIHPV